MNPSLRKNYIYHLAYEIMKIIMPFITAPYVSRVLGADGLGIYSVANSNITYFVLLAGLGTSTYAVREIARHRDDRAVSSQLFWEIEFLSMITSGVALILWLIVIALSTDFKIYYICLTPLLLSNMFDIAWYFTGQEQVKFVVIRNLICKLIGTVCLFVFIRKKSDLPLYIIINTMVTLLGSLSMWSYLPGRVDRPDFKNMKLGNHFRQTLVYFIPTIATSVYTVLDKTLIGFIAHDNYQSGYYEQATNIINMVKPLVFTSVNSVVGARSSYLYYENKVEEIRHKLHTALSYILLLAYGCTFGLWGVSRTFIPRFLGEDFMPVATMINMLAPLIFIIGMSNCLGSIYYTPSGKRAQSSRYLIYGSIINLIFNILLIPRYSAYGAIISSLIAETVITILYVMNDEKMLTWKDIWNISYKKLISAAVMLVLIMLLDKVLPFSGYPKVFAEIILGGSMYLIMLYVLKDPMFRQLMDIALGMINRILRRTA